MTPAKGRAAGRQADLRGGEAGEQLEANLEKGVLFPKFLGRPEELASMVVEAATNSYLNGETIRVDGGIRMQPT